MNIIDLGNYIELGNSEDEVFVTQTGSYAMITTVFFRSECTMFNSSSTNLQPFLDI